MEPTWLQTGRCFGPLGGVDFRPPGGRFSLPEGCEMAFQRLPGAGVRRALRTASGGKGEPNNCMDGSWGRLGAVLAALGLVLGRLLPPGRRPEEAQGGHF